MSNVWKTLEWRDKASVFIKDKFCAWCGQTEHLVPHHPHKKGGYTREEYLSLIGCIVLCKKCNFMENKHYKLCPECKTHYYKPKHNHNKLCWNCFILTPSGKLVKEYYDQHPEKLKKKRSKTK